MAGTTTVQRKTLVGALVLAAALGAGGIALVSNVDDGPGGQRISDVDETTTTVETTTTEATTTSEAPTTTVATTQAPATTVVVVQEPLEQKVAEHEQRITDLEATTTTTRAPAPPTTEQIPPTTECVPSPSWICQ